ncbi:MAG: hypothetical protein ACREBM_01105, partial [Sphingomicrobium sp.]
MTKLFLAAGVAALAISAPATAGPGGHNGHGAKAERAKDSGGKRSTKATERRAARSEVRSVNLERRAGRSQARSANLERRNGKADRVAAARPEKANRVERQQVRIDRRDQVRDRSARQDLRAQRIDQRLDRRVERSGFDSRFANANGRGLIDGCPPGLFAKANGCLPPGQAKKLLGVPLATASAFSALNSFPSSVSYLYPDTDDHFYRYGDGYAYRVDRDSNLISALIPLLAGGYMPGGYLPTNYMNSYVPNYYGLSSFYPDSPYDCHRYVNGIIYEVDCVTGMIEGVVPLYAGGYGVGQMLPSAYYNLPYGYRGLYADTSDYGYYYAPGAIYQYDQGSSLITSVAALLTPGFGVGQQLPMGYG